MPERNPAASTLSPTSESAVTVLLVDDQAMIGDIIRHKLANQPNLHFFHCTDPREAMTLAEHLNPTVILLDLVLPGINGLTLLRQYRDNPLTRDVPIVVLSIKDEPRVKSQAFRLGANDYLVKLPDSIELAARVRYHSKAYLNQIQRDEAYHALRERQKRLMQMTIELQRLTNIDGLTGLHNRRYLDEHLTSEWKRAMREQSSLSVLMIDVDEFKRYNDTYGHLAGDEILKQVAATIRESAARPADIAARFGGEEFAMVLPNTVLQGARHVAEKVRSSMAALQIPHSASATGHVTISIGVAATIPQRDGQLTVLVEAADAALYEAKEAGRNRVVASPVK